MKKLSLFPTFTISPLFCHDVDKMGPVEISDLPVSAKLKAEIRDWDDAFQSIYNTDYPPDSAFGSETEERAHRQEGLRLAQALRDELGDGFIVDYRG